VVTWLDLCRMFEMSIPEEKAAKIAVGGFKIAQLVTLVKENQLVTALVVFVLWQAGAFVTVSDTVGGCI